MKNLYLVIAIISLVAGIATNNAMVDGLGKALFGVFFILYLIIALFGPAAAHPEKS